MMSVLRPGDPVRDSGAAHRNCGNCHRCIPGASERLETSTLAQIDRPTFEKPHRYATGVEYVLVNGKVVLDRGRHTRARPGAIVYGQEKGNFVPSGGSACIAPDPSSRFPAAAI